MGRRREVIDLFGNVPRLAAYGYPLEFCGTGLVDSFAMGTELESPANPGG